jgi:hypothetical protein
MALIKVGGHHIVCWEPNRTKRQRKGKFSLSFFDLRYLYSPALGCWIRLWDLYHQPLRLGVKPLDLQGLRSLDSNELHNRIPGSLACRHWIVRLLVSITLGAYSYNKSSLSLSDIYIYKIHIVMFYCLFLWRILIITRSKLYALILSNYFLHMGYTYKTTIAFHIICTSVLFYLHKAF